MASLYKRTHSPFWWIKYRDRHGKLVRQSTKFRVGVGRDTRAARELQAAKSLEEARCAQDRSAPWHTWVPEFIATTYAAKPKTLERYQTAWRTLAMFLEENHITSPKLLHREHCARYIQWRARSDPKRGKYRACHNTALLELKILGRIMKEALTRGYATTNPCRELGIARQPQRVRPEFTDEQLAQIEAAIEAEPEPLRTFLRNSYLIARYHGVRLSETYLNPMRDVELGPQPLIRFVQKGGRHTVKPLHPKLIPLFEQLRAQGATETYQRPRSLSKTWHAFLKRAGIKTQSPNACFHSLRVTAASRLARNNVPIRKAMEYLSHASTTVHNAYVRWRPEDLSDCHKAL